MKCSSMVFRYAWVAALAVTTVLVLAPTPAAAKATSRVTPTHPTVNVTVHTDGHVSGNNDVALTVVRTDKPTGVLQSCSKVQTIGVFVFPSQEEMAGYSLAVRNEWQPQLFGYEYIRKSAKSMCSFRKQVHFRPFPDSVFRGICFGKPNGSVQTLATKFNVGFNTLAAVEKWVGPWVRDVPVTAHVTCDTGGTSSSAPSAGSGHSPNNTHPVNACNFSGSWAVWRTPRGQLVSVPFVLVANHGHSDFYTVSLPNNAGLTGTAVVTGSTVTLSLQSGGNGAGLETLSGTLDHGCTQLSGQAVRSDTPIGVRATRRGGRSHNTTRSAGTVGRTPNAVHHHTTPPHVNTRVTPKWNTQLR